MHLSEPPLAAMQGVCAPSHRTQGTPVPPSDPLLGFPPGHSCRACSYAHTNPVFWYTYHYQTDTASVLCPPPVFFCCIPWAVCLCHSDSQQRQPSSPSMPWLQLFSPPHPQAVSVPVSAFLCSSVCPSQAFCPSLPVHFAFVWAVPRLQYFFSSRPVSHSLEARYL